MIYPEEDTIPRHFMGIWSEEVFDKKGPPDIDVIKLGDPQDFDIRVPEHLGNIYLGILENNLTLSCTPDDIVNMLQGLPLAVGSDDILGIKLYVNSALISVWGEVKKEGTYTLTEEMTILDAITLAGGYIGKGAEPSRIQILRLEDGMMDISTTQIREKRFLRAGDRIYVE